MAHNGRLVALDLAVVRKTHHQLRGTPVWQQVPRIYIPGKRKGIESVTYRLSLMSNSLVKADVPDWEYGQEPPSDEELEYGTVELSSNGSQTHPWAVAEDSTDDHVLEDLGQRGIIHLDRQSRKVELKYNTFLNNSTFFNTKAFSNGPLSSQNLNSTPAQDIEAELDLRKYREIANLMGLSLELHAHTTVLRKLIGYEEYSKLLDSAGATSRRPKSADPGAAGEALSQHHGFDRVIALDSLYSSARAGQTASYSSIFNGTFWIGLVDRSAPSMTITPTSAMATGLGGAVVAAISSEPKLREWVKGGPGVQRCAAFSSIDFTSPVHQSENLKLGTYFTSTLS